MSKNSEYIWYQVQFLNANREYEDCFEGCAESLDVAFGYMKKKKSLFCRNYRIVERKESERVVSEEELKEFIKPDD